MTACDRDGPTQERTAHGARRSGAWLGPVTHDWTAMTDPGGSDRIQQDVPTSSGTGDDSSSGTGGSADVPLTADEAIARDSASDDEQPAQTGSEPSLAQRATPHPTEESS